MGGHEHGRPVVFRNRPFFVFAWACLALIAYLFGLAAASIGSYIRMMMFGGSLYGVVTRYRAQRKVAARMNAARERIEASQPASDPSARYARAIRFSPWPPLAILAVMEAIAAIGLLAR